MTNNNDPFISFLHSLLNSERQKNIITMLSENKSEEEIIEKLINYSEEKGEDSDDKI